MSKFQLTIVCNIDSDNYEEAQKLASQIHNELNDSKFQTLNKEIIKNGVQHCYVNE